MVKKLLKYEFMYLGRVLVPMAIAVPSLALLSSLTLLIPSGAGFGFLGVEIMQSLLPVLFFLAICGFVIAAYVLCIIRFQKSTFSKEGYFTLSLPVDPMQLLWAKFLAAILTVLITFLIAFGSVELFGAIHGEELVVSFLQAIFDLVITVSSTGVLAYGIIVVIIGGMCQLLFIYACVAAGQLVNKHRGWLSLGCYVIISEVLSTVFSFISIPLSLIAVFNKDEIAYSVLSISLQLVQYLILGVGSVFFVRYILKNKVNLQA